MAGNGCSLGKTTPIVSTPPTSAPTLLVEKPMVFTVGPGKVRIHCYRGLTDAAGDNGVRVGSNWRGSAVVLALRV